MNAYQNRLLGCYLDLNHLDLMGGGSQSIVVESSFFLGTNTRIYGAGAGGSGIVSNTYMQANLGDSVQLVGNFTEATRCLIGGAGDSGPSTRATKRLTLVGAWVDRALPANVALRSGSSDCYGPLGRPVNS